MSDAFEQEVLEFVTELMAANPTKTRTDIAFAVDLAITHVYRVNAAQPIGRMDEDA